MLKTWGKHLIVDLKRCMPISIRCPIHLQNFSKELVDRIDMKAYGEPIIRHFGDGNKSGYTLVQLIETSNIIAHFAEESNDAYIDVFSCKDFHQRDVEDVIHIYFHPEELESKIILRG
jgi:S-adenosylmethionine/arginine decarboxylase-like enzyme